MHILKFCHISLNSRLHIHIFFVLCRYKMIVAVRYFVPKKSGTNPITTSSFLDCWGKSFCCLKYSTIVWFWYFRKMIYFALWYDEHMPRCLRKYIEKCKSPLIFIDFEGGDFSCDDFREKRGHSGLGDRFFCFLLSCRRHPFFFFLCNRN